MRGIRRPGGELRAGAPPERGDSARSRESPSQLELTQAAGAGCCQVEPTCAPLASLAAAAAASAKDSTSFPGSRFRSHSLGIRRHWRQQQAAQASRLGRLARCQTSRRTRRQTHQAGWPALKASRANVRTHARRRLTCAHTQSGLLFGNIKAKIRSLARSLSPVSRCFVSLAAVAGGWLAAAAAAPASSPSAVAAAWLAFARSLA